LYPLDFLKTHEKFDGKQARLLRELEDLGINAVPYIVARMDDRRLLPFQYIALQNKAANRFEIMRQYSPELVVDALTAVLNQTTGEHFGFLYNGADDSARDASVLAWREYLKHKFPKDYPYACAN